MVLGFKPQFEDLIQTGQKKHTIREDKHDRWKAGRVIHFATGVRTKRYTHFKTGQCVSVQAIEINYDYTQPVGPCVSVFIDDRFLHPDEIKILAKNDGFEDTSEFFDWFNKDFKGKIIHWTDLKY